MNYMSEQSKLITVIVWGGANEEKTTSPTRWMHDYILFASREEKLSILDDPEILLPYIFDADLNDISSQELYDGVFEYKTSDLIVELVTGLHYTEYKLYSDKVDFDTVTQRLKKAGVKFQKPEIIIDVPGRPPIIDVEKLKKQRYDYHENIHDRDVAVAKSTTIKAAIKTVVGFAVFIVMTTFFGIEILVPKYQNVTPVAEDMFITMRGNYLVYNINNRMTVYKFAELVEETGYDSTYKMYVPDLAEITDQITVTRMTDANDNVVYELGNRAVSYESNPSDYNFVNGKTFEFNTYGSKDENDWSQYGSLDEGNADKIALQGRIVEREGRYMMLLGTVWAVLGDISEGEPQFYDLLRDDLSYATVQYSLKARKVVNLFGQIDKTYTSREGRNSVDKLVFLFKSDYARKR